MSPNQAGGIRVILFDLGNTLIYFDADWKKVIRQSAEWLGAELSSTCGCPVTPKEFADTYLALLKTEYDRREVDLQERTSAWVLTQMLDLFHLPPAGKQEIKRLLAGFYAVLQQHWKTEVDTHAVLSLLAAQGFRLGLVSNAADDADVQVLVDQAGIRDYFDVILTSAAAGVRKPHPAIFWKALSVWSAKPAEVVMVGDLLGADIVGARNLGIRNVWITRRADVPHNQQRLTSVTPDAQISSLLELPAVIQEWIKQAEHQ